MLQIVLLLLVLQSDTIGRPTGTASGIIIIIVDTATGSINRGNTTCTITHYR